MTNRNTEMLEIFPSSGNVFEDMGLDNAGAYFEKVKLAHQINQSLENAGIGTLEAAILLDADSRSILDLNCGRLDAFSLEELNRLSCKLEYNKPREVHEEALCCAL